MWCRQQDGGHGSWNPRKECVTTHLQNHIVPKTDGAQAVDNYLFNIDYPTLDHLLCKERMQEIQKFYPSVYFILHIDE